LIFADLDNDGIDELIAAAPGGEARGIYVYKRPADPRSPWIKSAIHQGQFLEGTSVADVNADGRLEVLCGPDLFFPPDAGPFSGLWRRQTLAPGFREMCRTSFVDITGNGRPDAILAESEYLDGRFSWFENRVLEDPAHPWIEHVVDEGLYFAHSQDCRREADGSIHVFIGEMALGGWLSHTGYNYNARVMEYVSTDHGKNWKREILYQGAGTHEARFFDVDGDGRREVVGKVWGSGEKFAQVQIFKQASKPSPIEGYAHSFVDRDKPAPGTDVFGADVRGVGVKDVFCGRFWYRNPGWERTEIPGICQAIDAWDVDGDGRDEIIGCEMDEKQSAFSNRLCWLKLVDPDQGTWEKHAIGQGVGDWPHGSLVAPVLPGGKAALIVSYHSAHSSASGGEHYPELYEIPENPKAGLWPKRTLAPIRYGEEIVAHDITGNGLLDLFAGCWWLENMGDGTFTPHEIVKDFYPARLGVMDVNGDGRPDVILGEETLDYPNRRTLSGRVAWFECPADPRSTPWPMHAIDRIRCPHSIGVADLDGDGELEILAGEHDPFQPLYRSRCRLFVYKKADPQGISWRRYLLDARFEHHDGARPVELSPGQISVLSHGWKDVAYVSLWQKP
jgi:hypothetical protein